MSKAVWGYKKLNELGFVGRGKSKHRPRNAAFLYGGPYPFVQTGDVKEADLYITGYSQTYSEAGLAQSKLWEPDTLCITIAANIAETAILKIKACFPDSIVGFVADPTKADVRFVKYYIDTIKLKMQNVSKGTTQDNLSLEKLLSFDFFAPPVETQRKIAAILSAYDDLIENNTRRIKILEEMAQLLYREWFVHFRFPGHGGVKMKNGVPEGWAKGVFSDIAELSRDSVNPGKFEEESFAHYSIPAFDEGQMPVTEQGSVIKSNKFLVRDNCVLLSKINPRITRVWLPVLEYSHRAIASTEFLVLTPKPPATRAFLFNLCQTHEFLGKFTGLALGTSTSHQRVKPDDLLKMLVSVPAPTLLARYDETVMPMLSLAHTLRVKNANLRRTRDLLLPRLVSGEADVEGLKAVEGG